MTETAVRKAELARRLGISDAAISKAIRVGRIPAWCVLPDGRVLLEHAARAMGRALVQPADSTPVQAVPAQQATMALSQRAADELKALQAEKLRRELERDSGATMSRAAVEEEVATGFRLLRDRLLLVPAEAGDQLDGKSRAEIITALRGLIERALTEGSERIQGLAAQG